MAMKSSFFFRRLERPGRPTVSTATPDQIRHRLGAFVTPSRWRLMHCSREHHPADKPAIRRGCGQGQSPTAQHRQRAARRQRITAQPAPVEFFVSRNRANRTATRATDKTAAAPHTSPAAPPARRPGWSSLPPVQRDQPHPFASRVVQLATCSQPIARSARHR